VASDERPSRPNDKVKAEVDVDAVSVANQAEHAAKFADELVRTMGFSASVRTEIDEDDVTVHIEGDGLGALVGPRGVTIQALEEVVRAVVQHHAGGHSAWVHVDVAGYRQRRRAALAEFARQVAAEVIATGEERALEPMTAADRKVVHDVISEVDGVDTTSEGEEPRRRVVVLPA
jgi:spoIIIJ-associated protein